MASIPTLVAYDGSGSTGNSKFYHTETQKIISDLPRDTQFLFWDTEGRRISRADLDRINAKCAGYGSTDPAAIAAYVRTSGFTGNLVIITDGQVGSVSHVDNILPPGIAFESVTAHLISTGGVVNMSVTCPFTRRSPHSVFTYDPSGERRTSSVVTAADLEVPRRIAEIATIADFDSAFPSLERAVIAATMGSTGDPSLRDSLLAMKARIQRADAHVKSQSDAVTTLNAILDDEEQAIAAARQVTHEYYYPAGTEEDPDAPTWSARIARLVSMTEGALRGSFDLSGISAAIRGDRARRAHTAAPVSVAAVTESTQIASFVCPITFDTETDVVLLVTDGPPLLADVDKNITKAVCDCPLNLLNYPELVTALKARLDHPVSLHAFKAAHDAGLPFAESPMTRQPLLAGGICLGATEDASRATGWMLANLFLDGKLIGNQDLWFAVVWLVAREIPYLRDIVAQFETQMRWRLTAHKTSLSLSGLPEFPTTRVPLRTAVWYVFANPRFVGAPTQDVLRAHMPHLAHLEELYRLAGFTLKDDVRAHILRLRVMFSMLHWVQRDRYTLPNLMLALRQACVQVGDVVQSFERTPKFIPIDGPPTADQLAAVRALLPPTWNELDVPTLVGLAALVDPSKSAGDIPLALSWTPPPLAPPVVEWFNGLNPFPASPVLICPATCRPFYHPASASAETWKDAAMRVFKFNDIAKDSVSINETYGNFVSKFGVYPTRDALLTYLYNRRVLHGSHTTLPHRIDQFIAEVIDESASITSVLAPAEFARRFNSSRKITERVAMEVH